MALDKDALSDLLDALRAGGDLVRSCRRLVLQALIELSPTRQIGAQLPYAWRRSAPSARWAQSAPLLSPRPRLPSWGRAAVASHLLTEA